MKLKDILQESGKDAFNRSLTREEKRSIMDSIAKFNDFGAKVYKTHEIAEMVEAIREMTKGASQLALQETDGWFDAVTVKRDMKEIATSTKLFEKAAKELSTLQQRLESVFEDIGHKLGKYYDISEALDPVGKEDGDIDNDGDEDESDEYLAKKRAAITKAIKNEGTIKEGFGTWEMQFAPMNLSGVKLDPKKKYRVKARNTVEAIKKAAKMAGVGDSWMATETHKLVKVG